MNEEEIEIILANHILWIRDNSLGTKANLSGANLYKANLSEADLYKANLARADLYKANLSGAYLSKANLSKANLSGANLYKANLSGANLSEANLSGADLSGANLSNIIGVTIFHVNYVDNEIQKEIICFNNIEANKLMWNFLSKEICAWIK